MWCEYGKIILTCVSRIVAITGDCKSPAHSAPLVRVQPDALKSYIMKPIKFAIAAVLVNPRNNLEVLAVKRPPHDKNLPNVWGLPAVIVKDGELPEEALKRLGVEKLSADIFPVSYIGIEHTDRKDYELILMDIEAELKGGKPSALNATTLDTKYIDQQWVSDFNIFKDAASKGSLCSRVFLKSRGISWE